MEKFERREFLKKAAAITTAGSMGYIVGCNSEPAVDAGSTPTNSQTDPGDAAAGSSSEENIAEKNVTVNTQQMFEWKCVTTWPPTLPIMQEGIIELASQIETMTEGRLKIEVYGGGELVPALESFDAVSQGTAEMGHGASYYWAGKVPASQFFTSVPFGMNAQQMYAWLYGGDGLALWEEAYQDVNLVPMPAGNTGIQMGGWFNKELNSVEDFNGLKMRMPGLGGKALSIVGASAELIAGGEIYTSLERGVIDATEWIGPYHDYVMGFYKVAQYYYYPGWHEPGSVLELIINRSAWEELPSDIQGIIRRAADAQNPWMLARFDAQNNIYLQRMITEEGVELRRFPTDVMTALREASLEVINEVAANDPMSKKVWENFQAFEQGVADWAAVSEKAFYEDIQRSNI